jgi:Flp pilus assembly protein TadG
LASCTWHSVTLTAENGADLLAQTNNQNPEDEWILTEKTNVLRIFDNDSEEVREFHSSRTAKTVCRALAQLTGHNAFEAGRKNDGAPRTLKVRNTPPRDSYLEWAPRIGDPVQDTKTDRRCGTKCL